MSETRYFTVTEERQVKVAAKDALEACVVADAAFRGEIRESDITNVNILTEVKGVSISAREDY